MTRRSEYVARHRHAGQEGTTARARPGDARYFIVYPFVKTREWYLLPSEERQRMMNDHFRVGHNYPSVRIHTSYSFGLDDQEFVVAFDTDSPSRLPGPRDGAPSGGGIPLYAQGHADLHLHPPPDHEDARHHRRVIAQPQPASPARTSVSGLKATQANQKWFPCRTGVSCVPFSGPAVA